MKYSQVLLFLLLCSCVRVDESSTEVYSEGEDTGYSAELAEHYGADVYGMRSYYLAFLKTGPATGLDQVTRDSLQALHMENIQRLADEGDLILAGPFMSGDEYRGIYLFDTSDLAEAQAMTMSDPAVKAGVFDIELRPWYGSAALMGVNDIHERISKENP